MTEQDAPTIFLSYAREDQVLARRLYDYLISVGAKVWFDREELSPGANWKNEIVRAIRASRFFVALLSSNSVSKKGFVHTEISNAIEVLTEYPDNEIYLVPVRIDDCCPMHPRLNDLSWLDLFPNYHYGAHRLAQAVGISTVICSGVYATRASKVGKYILRTFLRFYEDGTVVSCKSTGAPDDLALWFNRDHKLSTTETYTVKDGVISFVGAGDYAFLSYKGRILGRDLELRWHNQKTSERGVHTFKWQDVPVS